MSAIPLDDRAIREFISQGYTLVQADQPLEFHRAISKKIDATLDAEGNPGNNILPRVPELGAVFDSPSVKGALHSLLGPGYSMHPHRYCHLNRPGSKGQNWHKDDYVFDSNARHHRFRVGPVGVDAVVPCAIACRHRFMKPQTKSASAR